MNNVHLRKFKTGSQLPWTEEELLVGFRKFYDEYGRYPAAGEIDTFPYLPSARTIQRSHGGLVMLRSKILPGEEPDHTKGLFRRQRASDGDKRAKLYEEEFYKFLINHFDEISIHEHKIVRPGNVACDVFIYLDDTDRSGIVIDLFYSQDLVTLLRIVNIKIKRYASLPYTVLFILVGNDSISNNDIEVKMKNRRYPLPDNISVINELIFKQIYIKKLKERSVYSKE